MQKRLFTLALSLQLAWMPAVLPAMTDRENANNMNSSAAEYTNSDCDAGAPINGELVSGTNEVKIWWGEQSTNEHCLFYDDGINVDAVGMTNGGSFYWGIKFPAESLSQYAGYAVTRVAYYDNTAHTGNILVYSGTGQNNRPDLLLSSTPYTAYGSREYIEWEIPAVNFDNTKDLWIVMHNDYGMQVASAGAYCGDPNGSMMAAGSGQYWYPMDQILGSYGTWNLRCYVSDRAGKEVSLENKNNSNRDIIKYNVYRSSIPNGDYTLIGEVEAVEGQDYYEFIDTPDEGNNYYQVRADYGDCLSDPAQSADDPSVDYVNVSITSVSECNAPVALFPNPTKGDLTIQANGLLHVTIINALGQIVYDTNLTGNECGIKTSQFTTGIYTARITTTAGVVVKKFSVL